jgi:hypothetical protein
MTPFLITRLISYSFNQAAIFCMNISVTVLMNQYSTGLLVSYSLEERDTRVFVSPLKTVRRKTQLYETVLTKQSSLLRRFLN